MTDTPNNGSNERRPHDYIFFCDICGNIEWASKGTLLSIYTGHGNQMACPLCVLAIDYKLVPYIVPAEKPVPWARANTLYDTPANQVPNDFPPFNFATEVPGSGPPGTYVVTKGAWESQTIVTWEQWLGAPWDKLTS